MLFCRQRNTDWEITKYIIELGGDINFPIEWDFPKGWDDELILGSGINYGRATELAKHLEIQNRRRNNSKDFYPLYTLLSQKVKNLCCFT